jgi:ABC-type nitrate/sulfonate/bicarbonate transport system permease component
VAASRPVRSEEPARGRIGSPRRRRVARRAEPRPAERMALSLAGIALVLGIWQLLSDRGTLNPLIWSSPSRIWNAFETMVSSGSLWPLLGESAKLFAVGLAVSISTGTLIGAALGWYATARAVFEPWMTMLYAMPALALVPLFEIAFGSGFETQVIVVWTVAVFPVLINVAAGVGTTDRDQLEVARSFLATNRDVLWGVAIPGALPYLIAGIQQALALSLVGVVVAEYFIGNNGLGGLILTQSEALQTPQAYVGVLLFAIAGVSLTALLRRCERWLVRWR